MAHIDWTTPRAVYIGGFGNGKGTAETVALALESYYDVVDPFTFSEAMDDPAKVRRAVKGVDVITHSAGLLAAADTNPRSIAAYSPPLPTSKIQLFGKTGLKALRMHTPGVGIRKFSDVAAVNHYNISALAEIIAHPVGNLGRLGLISRFDAVDTAVEARQSGIPTSLIYTRGMNTIL